MSERLGTICMKYYIASYRKQGEYGVDADGRNAAAGSDILARLSPGDNTEYVPPAARTSTCVFTTFCGYRNAGSYRFPTLQLHLGRIQGSVSAHPAFEGVDPVKLPGSSHLAEALNSFAGELLTSCPVVCVRLLVSKKRLEVQLEKYSNPWEDSCSSDSAGVSTCSFTSRRAMPQLKRTPALESSYARSFAIQRGYQEAIFQDSSGHLLEGAWSNLFWFNERDQLCTSFDDSVLNGVTREIVCSLNSVRFEKLHWTEVGTSVNEMFLTQSTSGITPVGSFNELKLRVDRRRTEKLAHAYALYLRNCMEQEVRD